MCLDELVDGSLTHPIGLALRNNNAATFSAYNVSWSFVLHVYCYIFIVRHVLRLYQIELNVKYAAEL